jgi:hypothetical protein
MYCALCSKLSPYSMCMYIGYVFLKIDMLSKVNSSIEWSTHHQAIALKDFDEHLILLTLIVHQYYLVMMSAHYNLYSIKNNGKLANFTNRF